VSTWLIPVSVLPVASATGRLTLYPYQWAAEHLVSELGLLTLVLVLMFGLRARRSWSTSKRGSPS
jgi:hypothetical protein